MIEAIKAKRWREVKTLTRRQQALCAVADKLSAQATRMTEDDWKPLRELGFDDRACLEVAHIVGIFNYLTRLADGFGLRLDAPVAEASSTGIALRQARTAAGVEPR